MRISNLLLGLLVTASTTMGECYRHGEGWDRINGNVTKSIEEFCNWVGVNFKGYEFKRKCYQFGKYKLDFFLKNNQKTAQSVSTEECEYIFMKDKEDCWHGGDQERNGFQYWIDPNKGKCPDKDKNGEVKLCLRNCVNYDWIPPLAA